MTDLQAIKALILRHAMFYGEVMADEVIAMHANALADIPLQALSNAYEHAMRTSKSKRMPMPGEIRESLELSDDVKAREIASNIVNAIATYGYTAPERAREFLGETAWRIVKLEGGWEHLCATVTNENLPIFKAQIRELSKSVLQREVQTKLVDSSSGPLLGLYKPKQISKE